MIRPFLAAAAAALTVALVCGARAASAYTPHVMSYADNLDVSSLNIFLATSGNINALSELTMGEFTRFGPDGKPIPELVTEIPSKSNGGVSADGTTIVWHLRHNVRWSDGAPFDARDVTYTYRVAMDPGNNIAVRDVWERLASVVAPDRYTVVFHLKRPYALFVTDYFSTISNSCILPAHALGPGTSINQVPYNEAPVGIGPFRYTAYHRGDRVEMEANPYYWRGKAKLHNVVYKIITDDNTLFTQLQTGELDLWDTIEGVLGRRVQALPGKATSLRTSNYMSAIFFNTQRPAVADPAVRRALTYATDRKLILAKVALGFGVLTQSLVPRTTIDYLDLPLTPYEPKRAAALLDAAGWKRATDGVRAKNGVPLTIDIAVPAAYAPSASMADVLHDDWDAIGANVTIHTWASSQFFATFAAGGIIQTGKFDAALYAESLGPVYSNINGVYDCESIPPHGFNGDRYCNPTVDALNGRYVRSFDPKVRAGSAAAFQRIINGDAPGIVAYERTFLAGFDARLRGYHPSSYSYWGDPLQLDL